MINIPKMKVGIVAVSRDCFPESLSVNRRKALVDAYTQKYNAEDIYECPVCIVESEIHMVQALDDLKKAGCNALCVYLGNFGPEIAETLLAKHFDGPKMFCAAAEENTGVLSSSRGDAYCGMLNASYNLKLRGVKAYIPEYPVGTAAECADMIHDFLPIARAVYGLNHLKIISFGPRPLNFLACNAPIQQLYNLADSFVAGKFVGESALAAVGNSYEITLIFIAFAFGCNIGCSVIVSQLFGAKRMADLKTAVYTTLISSGIVCLLLMGLGTLLCTDLLELIHTPEDILPDSKLYLDIYILGLPFVFYYNVATGIFSALGDSKTPFYFLAASSLSNIAVDILFVTAFQMGVAGVAWATFLCQGVSCVLAVVVVFRRFRTIETERKPALFSWVLLKKIAVVAIPSILQQSFISVGNIIIQGVINTFGSSVIAGYSAAVKLNNLVITSFTTLGNGISNYTAQNIGAEKPDRVRQGFKAGVKLVWMLSLPLVALYLLGGGVLLRIFLDDTTGTAMQVGIQFLRVLAPFYFVISAKLVSDGILRGAGLMKQFMAATFTDLILRVVLAKVLSGPFGTLGIWCAWPIGWTIAAVMSVLFYRQGPWNKK